MLSFGGDLVVDEGMCSGSDVGFVNLCVLCDSAVKEIFSLIET